MSEGVRQARRREELFVWSLDPFRHSDNTVVVPRQSLLDLGQKTPLIEHDLGQQQYVWSITFVFGGERASGGDPASMPAHHFQSEHFGRGAPHRRHIERRLAK